MLGFNKNKNCSRNIVFHVLNLFRLNLYTNIINNLIIWFYALAKLINIIEFF
jgi:hypothetical protein